MKLILLIILAVLAGWGMLQIGAIDPDNYVKIYIANHVVEIKVFGLIVALFALVVVLYILLRLFRIIWKSPGRFANWRHRSGKRKAEENFGAGYLSLIKGDWKRAEAQLTAKTKFSDIRYVNFLAAAQAAQEQGKIVTRDEYIQAAYDAAPKERLAIGMTKAKLHQQAGQIEQAVATLNEVQELGRKNPQFTAMRLQAAQSMGDWEQVNKLLPAARKQAALDQESLEDVENNIKKKVLEDAEDLKTAWGQLPRALRKRLALQKAYAEQLISRGNHEEAEKQIRSALKNDWSEDLVTMYGHLESEKPAKLQRTVEGWLLAHPDNPAALVAAARLAAAANDDETAKKYLQQAIVKAPTADAFGLLAKLYEKGNQSGKALELYRQSLALLTQEQKRKSKPIATPAIAANESAQEATDIDAESVDTQEQTPDPKS